MSGLLLKIPSEGTENLISSGIDKVRGKLRVPLWIDGSNVVFKDQTVKKVPGWYSPFTPTGAKPVRGGQQVLNGTSKLLYFGDYSDLYSWNESVVNLEGSGYGGQLDETSVAPATCWSMAAWGTWCVASNNLTYIQVNKANGAGFTSLSNGPTRAKVIRKFKNFLIAFNTALSPTAAQWCKADDIETWDTATTEAKNLYVRDFSTEIIAVEELGDGLAMYSNNQMIPLRYIGNPFWFVPGKGLSGIGAVSLAAVVSTVDLNYGLSRQGFWKTNGVSKEYLSNPNMLSWLNANVNWSQKSKINSHHYQEQDSVVWSVPTVGVEPDTDVVYNYKKDVFSFLSKGNTFGAARDIFEYPVTGGSNGKVYFQENGTTANGVAMTSFVQTRPIGEPGVNFFKVLDRLKLELKGNVSSLVLYVGTQDTLDAAITWDGPYSLSTDMENIWFNVRESKYFSFKLQSTGSNDSWQLDGVSVFGELTSEDR